MPSAEYTIDIAAAMPAGAQTIAQLDQMTRQLAGAGKGAEHFQQALAQASSALDAAKASSVSANAALADGAAQYKILEKAALQTAKAEEKAARNGAVPPAVAQAALAASVAVSAYAKTLRGLEDNAAGAAKKETELARTLSNVQTLSAHVDRSLSKQAESTGKLKGALAGVGGPLGRLGSQLLAPADGFAKMAAEMGSANASALVAAAGFAAVAATVVAVTVAAVAGALAVASWAVGLADSARSANLNQDALEALDPVYASIRASLSGLTSDTGQSRAALDGLAKQLIGAKVSAQDLPDALRAAALAETALGHGGATQFIDKIKAGTLTVNAFAANSQAKFGGIVAKQMLGLSSQSERLKGNIAGLFGGLNIDPVLSGVQRLVGLFDETTVAGQTIKFLFGKVFQPLIDNADKAALVIEAFALGFLIGLTKTYIALKPVIKAVSEFFGFHDTSLSDTLAFVTKAAEYLVPAFLVLVGVFAAVAAVIGVAVAAVVGIQVAIYSMIAAVIYGGVAVVQGIIGAWGAVTSYLKSISLSAIGTDILRGLAEGIMLGGPAVLHALTGVVSGAVSSAKKLLGIASPSKVFAEIGDFTGRGFAQGLDASAPQAQDSIAAMVEPPARSGLTAQDALSGNPIAAKAPASQGGADLSGAQFHFHGVKDAESAIEMLREKFTLILEGDAAALGT